MRGSIPFSPVIQCDCSRRDAPSDANFRRDRIVGHFHSRAATAHTEDSAIFLDDAPVETSVDSHFPCKASEVRAYVLEMVDQLAKLAHQAGDFTLASELGLMALKSTADVSAAITASRRSNW